MPYSRDGFDTVLNECLATVTQGRLVAPDETVLVDQTDQIVDDWTAPRPNINLDHISLGNITLLKHPKQAEFDEADAEDIAKVRLLGRHILDTAKHSLLANPHYTSPAKKQSEHDTDVAVHFMSVVNWYDARPGRVITEADTDSRVADVADPNRLRDWPKGEYLNCLGAAIGAAAICELRGLEYRFGNELRTGENILAQHHTKLKAAIENVYPGIFSKNNGKLMMQNLEVFNDDRSEKYSLLFFKDVDDLVGQTRTRDFHHFVVGKDKENGWIQVDPYALTLGWLAGEEIEHDAMLQEFDKPRYYTAVELYEAKDQLTTVYDIAESCVARLRSHRDKLRRLTSQPDAYKSANFMQQAHDAVLGVAGDISEVFNRSRLIKNPANSGPELEKRLREQLELVWHTLSVAYGTVSLPDKEVDAATEAFFQHEKGTPWTYGRDHPDVRKLEGSVHQLIRQDSLYRRMVLRDIEQLPAIFLMDFITFNLEKNMQLLSGNVPNAAMEIGEPDFMVGAMYMNHYATFRKDGKINVARHLARLTPSQLLWQAAQQESCEGDERIEAVGEVINNLKPHQLHPLVNLARHISQPIQTRS